eukprot:1358639-Rhodomonas_salina.1
MWGGGKVRSQGLPELQNFWKEKRIYERLHEESKGEKWVLHDGPPYANGDLPVVQLWDKAGIQKISGTR